MTSNLSLLGDAVHNVLTYFRTNPLTLDEDFEKRIAHVQTSTSGWSGIDPAYQERIRTHWRSIAAFYTEAHSAWLEVEGPNRYKPDMVRRMPDAYEVLEFKITGSGTLNQRSRAQVRDVMTMLYSQLPAEDRVVKGYRVILPIDLSLPPEPVWHEISFNPAS